MAVYLIDKIKPKNNGTFGMADTVDIDHSDGRRLDVVLDEIAEKADGGGTAVTALTKRVETAEGKIAAAENALAKKVEINDADTSATATYSSTKIEDAITAAKQAVKDELLDGAGKNFKTQSQLIKMQLLRSMRWLALTSATIKLRQSQTLRRSKHAITSALPPIVTW